MKVSKEDRTQVINFVQGEGVSTYYGYNPLPYLEVAGSFGSPLGPPGPFRPPSNCTRSKKVSDISRNDSYVFTIYLFIPLFMEFRKIRESESDKGISNSSITRGLNYTGTAVRWSSYYTDRLKENPKMLYTVLST
jgi:hypothetical protein